MTEIFALDLGNIQTKLKSSKGNHVLLSSFVPSYEIGTTVGMVNSEKDLNNFISELEPETEYAWGKYLPYIKSVKNNLIQTISFEQRYKEKDYLLLTDFALAYLEKDFNLESETARDVVVVMGLPTADYSQEGYKKDLPAQLKGLHTVTVNGKKLKINVKGVIVVNQSVGTLYNLTFDDAGELKDSTYIEGNGIVIDYGGGTVLMDGYENARLTNDRVQLEVGAFKFYKDVVADYTKNNISKIPIKELDVQLAVREGNDVNGYYYKPNLNTKVDITEEVQRQKEINTRMILRNITTTFKNLSLYDYVVITGGGANLLNKEIIVKELESYGIQVKFMGNSEFSNVTGYYKYGLAYTNQV